MDWMKIGSEPVRRERGARVAVAAGAAVAVAVAAALALPHVVPWEALGGAPGAGDQAQAEPPAPVPEQEGPDAPDEGPVGQDGEPEPRSAVAPDLSARLAGLSEDDVAALAEAVAAWLEAEGLAPDTAVDAASAPETKGGVTVVTLAVGTDGGALRCTLADGAWALRPTTLAALAEGSAATVGEDARSASLAEAAEVGTYDAARLEAHLGKACADGLAAAWDDYAAAQGLPGAYDTSVATDTVVRDGEAVRFSITSPAPAGATAVYVRVACSYEGGSYAFEME